MHYQQTRLRCGGKSPCLLVIRKLGKIMEKNMVCSNSMFRVLKSLHRISKPGSDAVASHPVCLFCAELRRVMK